MFTPSNHDSYRGVLDYNTVLWGSWVILGKEGHKMWFAGDTGYCDVFQQIGKRYGPFDLAAIPIGAYEPRLTFKFVHASPEEAVKIHHEVRSKKSFGIHWGTFKLSAEYYLEPRLKTMQIVNETNNAKDKEVLNFLVPQHGETIEP